MFPSIHIVRPTDLSDVVAECLDGNRLTSFGLIPSGSASLKLALVETEGGQAFPFQYHYGGGYELAFIISGQGTIEIGDDEKKRQCVVCGPGDLVLIPPGVTYRVCNTRADEKLVAWVCFADQAQSYWPDGSPAEQMAPRRLVQALPEREIFLRHLPALNLYGCPVPAVNGARAALHRQRLVNELWASYQEDAQCLQALVHMIEREMLNALWWCQHSYQESVRLVRQRIEKPLHASEAGSEKGEAEKVWTQ